MNHMRNIKEKLNISAGSRNGATSGYSSLTDSQLFFGSQFWPENSQGMSQEMSMSSRCSQQSSQEGSDPKFATSYHTKPFMFGDLKEKNKAFGIIDEFEEYKKRAKEKNESETLAKEFNNFQETLNNVHQLVTGTERNTSVCQTVLNNIDSFASTVQNNLNSLQSDISKQFETLLNSVNSQKESMTGLEEKVQKSGDTTAELGSNLQSLKHSLEHLKGEQEREQNMLEEALKLLSTLVAEHSAKPNPQKVTDSAIQTSPALEQPFSDILQHNKLEGTQLTCNFEPTQREVPPQVPSCIIGKRKLPPRSHNKRKKRPLVLSQRSKHTVTNENRQPQMNFEKQQSAFTPLCEHRRQNIVTSCHSLNPDCPTTLPNKEIRSVADGRFIDPLSCWSPDSFSSVPAGSESVLERLQSESNGGSPEKPESLWQLFDMNCDSDLGF